MKKLGRTQLLDKVHLYTVRTLMGLTVAGCVVFGFQIYNYMNYVKPVRTTEIRKIREKEIALEQSEKEAELLRRQKEAENLMKH